MKKEMNLEELFIEHKRLDKEQELLLSVNGTCSILTVPTVKDLQLKKEEIQKLIKKHLTNKQ